MSANLREANRSTLTKKTSNEAFARRFSFEKSFSSFVSSFSSSASSVQAYLSGRGSLLDDETKQVSFSCRCCCKSREEEKLSPAKWDNFFGVVNAVSADIL